MATSPLPPVKDDRYIQAALEALQTYEQEIATIRKDSRSLSDIELSKKIDEVWQTFITDRAALAQKFDDERHTRLQALEAKVPIGPNIPSDTDRADAAVLHQAFDAALTAAREASADELAKMWVDASRFDDDMKRRAVLTASLDMGNQRYLDAWANGDPEREAGIQEMRSLRDLMMRRGVEAGWASKAFGAMGTPTQPIESKNLPTLLSQAAEYQRKRAAGLAR